MGDDVAAAQPQAARSSMIRRRSAAGGSPESLRTSREKWKSEAELLCATSTTSVLDT